MNYIVVQDYKFFDLIVAIDFIANELVDVGRITLEPIPEFQGDQVLHIEFAKCLFDLVYARTYGKEKSLFWKLEEKLTPLYKILGGTWLVRKYQEMVYIDTYRLAIDKWPDLKKEILERAERLDLLEKANVCKMNEYKKGIC